jgi:hypothetical protein
MTLTWQATPRNKFNLHWSAQYNDANYGAGGGTATATPEATNRVLYIPSRQPRASWQSPISGKLLAEAGWGAYQARYRFHVRNDDTFNTSMIQRLEQVGEPGCQARGDCIPGLLSRMPRAPGQGGFTQSLIGTLASLHGSVTYVTGANNMKFGYQGGFSNPSQVYKNYTQVVQVRTNLGVPNQLTQTISVGPIDTVYTRNLIPTNFYAQDQWTRNRLTLQGGLRYDQLTSSYPDQGIGGPEWPYAPVKIFYPAGSTPGYAWKDITPRAGVAYDLFGNGKTAVRFNVGKYLEAITASNNDLDMNPLYRTVTNTTRNWTDANRDFVPNCDLNNSAANGECARMDRLWAAGCFRTDPTSSAPGRGEQLVDGPGGAAANRAARVAVGRLQPQLVGQLVRRGQPVDQPWTTHIASAPSIRGAAGRRGQTIGAVTRPAKVGVKRRARASFMTSRTRRRTGGGGCLAQGAAERARCRRHEHRAQGRGRLRRAGKTASTVRATGRQQLVTANVALGAARSPCR